MTSAHIKQLNPKVDWFFRKESKWQQEYLKLRAIALSCGLVEKLKWGCPCYTLDDGRNIVLIHGFKDYCALLFMKGALLKDPHGALVQQTANVQSGRQIRFITYDEVAALEPVLKTYIREAIQVEKSGMKVKLKETSEFHVPEEFRQALNENPKLKKAFFTLTPGRQRGYLLHFSSAKLSKTREQRNEKYMKKILNGKGLED